MCRTLPRRVVSVGTDGTAVVDDGGTPRTVALIAADEPVAVDDWVLVNAGLVVRRVDEAEASATHALWAELGDEA